MNRSVMVSVAGLGPRGRVPGGSLMMVTNHARGLQFYPDAQHPWDGGSLLA